MSPPHRDATRTANALHGKAPVLLFLLLLASAACGGSEEAGARSDPSPSAPQSGATATSQSPQPGAPAAATRVDLSNPCTLVSSADAAAALGVPIPAGKPTRVPADQRSGAPESTGCAYGAGGSIPRLLLGLYSGASSAAQLQSIAEKGAASPGAVKPLRGVGDAAFETTVTAEGREFHLVYMLVGDKGAYSILAKASGAVDPGRAAAREVARSLASAE